MGVMGIFFNSTLPFFLLLLLATIKSPTMRAVLYSLGLKPVECTKTGLNGTKMAVLARFFTVFFCYKGVFWGVNWGVKSSVYTLFLCYKNDLVHLLFHKLVVKVGVNPSDKPFRAVAHPYIHDIRANVLLAESGKCVAQIISREAFGQCFGNNSGEVSAAAHARRQRSIKVYVFPCLFRYGNFFIFDFSVLPLSVSDDEKPVFQSRFVLELAGPHAEKVKGVGRLPNLIKPRALNIAQTRPYFAVCEPSAAFSLRPLKRNKGEKGRI